jgi:MscS family membrane protein
MTQPVLTRTGRFWWLAMVATILTGAAQAADATADHPLEPPDRSSPRATLTTFLESIDRAWDLYSNGDPRFEKPFREARESLDLSEIPPLVKHDASSEVALLLKDVLDRIELPPVDTVPDRAAVEEQGLTRWTIPHTEILLMRIPEGDREGQWVFSAGTVRFAEEYYNRVRHLPYQPGRAGGHVEELRSGSNSGVVIRVVDAMPSFFKKEIGGMLVWQWCALVLLVVLILLALFATVWLGRLWHRSGLPGYRLAGFLLPLAMISVPAAGGYLIGVLILLPGLPAFFVRLVFSVVGFVGVAWLAALALTRIGDLVTTLLFRDARPLKRQFVRVSTRIATIAVVTAIALMAAHRLGVPVAGLIAGFGVGGLAIALASQSTLENFIGGVILYADQPVKVGDVCTFGDRRGTIEDVGLRSVRVRTLDRTLVTVPNADFARLQLENLSQRDRILLREELCVAYETTKEQLERLLTELRKMLADHPRIAEDPLRVLFTGFGTHFMRIEIFAYAQTNVWQEFVEIREDVLLQVMGLVERSGTRMALPTEVHYTPRDTGIPRSGA